MNKIHHKVKHIYQPTNTTCGQAALSMLLSNYNEMLDPLEIESLVPQSTDQNGEKMGTISQKLATWCLTKGYSVSMYTFDVQVIDQSWASLKPKELIARMKLRKNGWVVPGMGEMWTKEYTQSYIDFLETGGKLHIQPAVTTKILSKLLEDGPVMLAVSYSTLYGSGRVVLDQNQDKKDDVNGRATNHFVVLYGIDNDGNYLITDPFKKPGRHKIEPEILLAAISTAQIECDNLFFQIEPKL